MITLADETKDKIREALREFVEQAGGIDQASAKLNNISPSSIRNLLKPGFPNISDSLWRSVRAQIMRDVTGEKWQIVDTVTTRDIFYTLKEAQENKSVTWIVAPAGSGKTTSSELYCKTHRNAFYMECQADMNKSDFAQGLLRSMGIRVNTQKRSRDIIQRVIDEVYELEDVIFCFDEGDKLSDNIFYYFITLINRLKGKASMVFLSTSYIEDRMKNGVGYNKKGYQEIQSRIGRKFFMANPPQPTDVYKICMANGIEKKTDIDAIIKDAEQYNLDLRRVEKKVKNIKRKNKATEEDKAEDFANALTTENA